MAFLCKNFCRKYFLKHNVAYDSYHFHSIVLQMLTILIGPNKLFIR